MSEATGAQLHSAVERIIDGPAELIARLNAFEGEAEESDDVADDREIFERTADLVVAHYAHKTMISGGAAAAPAIVPVWGTILSLVPGNLADMTLCLKYETEMVQCLSALYGFDIRDDRERALALLIASVGTYELLGNEGPVAGAARGIRDLAELERQALWNYSPRQIGKLITKACVRLALRGSARGLLKAIPLVGIGVSALTNRVLTQRLGARARETLGYRVASEPR
jgi:uncharacterized protein (DUF697 family)